MSRGPEMFEIGDRVRGAQVNALDERFHDQPGTVIGHIGTLVMVRLDNIPGNNPENYWTFTVGTLVFDEPEPTDEEIKALFGIK